MDGRPFIPGKYGRQSAREWTNRRCRNYRVLEMKKNDGLHMTVQA